MTSIRLPISFGLAACTTVTMFWFLGMLIAAHPIGETIPIIPDIQIRSFVPEPVDPPRPPRRLPPLKTPKPTDNAVTAIRDPKVVDPGTDPTGLAPPDIFGPGSLGDPSGQGTELTHRGGSDRGPVPEIRLEPDYPPQLRDRGVEGWVTFRFTVGKDGRVRDVEIVDSQPARVWDSATIRAVSSWRYQPALKDGAPVEQTGLMATYRFELER